MRAVCLLAVAFLAGLALAPGAAAAAPHVRVIALDADVNPVTADWVIDEIHAAREAGDDAIVLELDTPGGLLSSMRKITQAQLRSPVPIIAYVAPSGARAASAGFFLLQAADLAAMVPASNTGAATPVEMGGGNVGSDLRAKLIQDAKAQIRFLAEGSGRNGTAAAEAVEPKSTACPRCPRSWTAAEAARENVIDLVATGLPQLLAASDGRVTVRKQLRLELTGATVERRELPLQLRILEILLDPNLITLLFLGGILGIAFELTHPGIVLPGLLGTVSLLLALLGLAIVPFSWAGIALLAFGIALLGARGAHPRARGLRGGRDARRPARRRAPLPRRGLALRHHELLARAGDRRVARPDRDVRRDAHLAGAAAARARRGRRARRRAGDGPDGPAPERPGARAGRALARARCPRAERNRASGCA